MFDGDEAAAIFMVRLGHNLARLADFGERQPEFLRALDDFVSRLVGEPLVHDRVDLVGVASHEAEQFGVSEARVRDKRTEEVQVAVVRVAVHEAIRAGPDGGGVRVFRGEAEQPSPVATSHTAVEIGPLVNTAEEEGGGLHS